MAGEKYAAIWFGAKDENQTATNKPEKLLYGTNHKRDVLAFDKTTAETAVWDPFKMPSFFDASKDITFTIVNRTSATSGTICWEISFVGTGDSEDEDPADSFVAHSAENVDGTANDYTYSTLTIAAASHAIAAGDMCCLKLRRKVASDDCDADVQVEGIELRIECTS